MTAAVNDRQQLVVLARTLERLLGRRRRLNKKVADLDEQIRQTRKFLNDLTLPDAGWPTTPVDAP